MPIVKGLSMNYENYTYPKFLQNRLAHWLWKKLFCRMGWHLWDEVLSLDYHYLYCDACEKEQDLPTE
jgi:hypothetical protein